MLSCEVRSGITIGLLIGMLDGTLEVRGLDERYHEKGARLGSTRRTEATLLLFEERLDSHLEKVLSGAGRPSRTTVLLDLLILLVMLVNIAALVSLIRAQDKHRLEDEWRGGA